MKKKSASVRKHQSKKESQKHRKLESFASKKEKTGEKASLTMAEPTIEVILEPSSVPLMEKIEEAEKEKKEMVTVTTLGTLGISGKVEVVPKEKLEERERKNPFKILEKRFPSISFGYLHQILDILKDTNIYDNFYTVESIEDIVPIEGEGFRVLFKNGKDFEIQYKWSSFQLQAQNKYATPFEVMQYLAGDKYDPEVESYGNLRHVFKAIKDKYPEAMKLFKEAVDISDWTYWASDDYRSFWAGEKRLERLKKLASMLGNEAQDYYEMVGKKMSS